jgi:hypothetical protein
LGCRAGSFLVEGYDILKSLKDFSVMMGDIGAIFSMRSELDQHAILAAPLMHRVQVGKPASDSR